LVASLVSLTQLSAALAQNSTSERNPIIEKCVSSTRTVIDGMRVELEKYPSLPSADKLVLFIPSADYAANALFKFKRIEISYAMCYEMLFNADAVAVVREAFPDQLHKLTAYSKEVSQQVVKAEKASTPGSWVAPKVQRFLVWAGVGDVWLPVDVAKRIEQQNEKIVLDMLALLLGHEVAHLAIGHKAGPGITRATAREQEVEADKKGYQLASMVFSTDGSPVALLPMFGLMNRRHSLIPGELDTHPIVECRVAYFFKQSDLLGKLTKVQLKPADEAYLNATLAVAKFKTGVSVTSLTDVAERVLQQPECSLYQ